jgi:hypothetical protein
MTSQNDDLLKMKDLALEMGSYYYKGFGNTINGILANAEIYLKEPNRKELAENAYGWLREIEEHYETIPFENLHGREEFYPLFVVKRLLPKLKDRMNRIFIDRDKDSLRNLDTDAKSIVNVGRLYGYSFLATLEQIRENPEAKDFRVKITDYRNQDWFF